MKTLDQINSELLNAIEAAKTQYIADSVSLYKNGGCSEGDKEKIKKIKAILESLEDTILWG